MSTDRPARLSELFHSALARDPSTRDAFLDEACRDDQGLRRELARLLAAQADAGSFLDAPVGAPAPVRLEPGTRLGSYSVTAFIGAGGMGEVYRARDPRLGREVAIKLLPEDEAGDAERRARFAREARAIAALNHPNIVTIHSIEESEGRHFLTMELVQGKTLRELLPPDGLPIDRLLAMAIPLADAIGTAHVHGIVHRDLKPANVMVTPDGRVKVLDFGLAKLKAPEELSESTALASAATKDGQLVGTVAYMSPEQADGREVDSRTDVFSLGVVLFELATGQRPFKGDSNVSLLSSIMKDVPPPVTELRPELPRELGRLIRRCLAKDPSRRYQSALDLRNDLEDLRDADEGRESALIPTPSSKSRAALVLGVGSLALVLGGALSTIIGLWRGQPDAQPAFRFQVPMTPASLERPGTLAWIASGRPDTQTLALSPDGRHLAFVGTEKSVERLYVRTLDREGAAVALDGTESARAPAFSPDGAWIAFWSNPTRQAGGGRLRKIPREGGPVTDIAAVDAFVSASWGEGNQIVFGTNEMAWKVSAAGGTPEELKHLRQSDAESIRFPQLIDSRTILYTIVYGHVSEAEIAIEPLSGGSRIILIKDGIDGRIVAGRYLLFMRRGTLWAAGFDAVGQRLSGPPVAVVHNVMQAYTSVNSGIETGTGHYACSSGGHLVYASGGVHPEIETVPTWFDRQGNASPVSMSERRPYGGPRLSADGRKVVFPTRGADPGLFVHDFARETTTRLRFDGRPWWPLWTPDGGTIVFSGETRGLTALYAIPADGSRPAKRLTDLRRSGLQPASWATERELLVTEQTPQTGRDISRLDLNTRLIHPVLHRPGPQAYPTVSPDGQWLAYASGESGGYEVFLAPYPALNWRIQVSNNGGSAPAWTRRGRELLFHQEVSKSPSTEPGGNYGRLMSVTISPGLGPRPLIGPRRELFVKRFSEFATGSPLPVWSVHPDGNRVLGMQTKVPPSPPPQALDVIVNWLTEVETKLRQASAR